MHVSSSEMGILSSIVSSTLKQARNRKPFDHAQLRHAYKVLFMGRYLSDPISYAADTEAMTDSARFLNIFDTGAQELQVMLTQTWITVEMTLKGELVDTLPAIRFFDKVAQGCPEEAQDTVEALITAN